MGGIAGGSRAALPEGQAWPTAGRAERMLRVHFVQRWNGLQDEGVDDAIAGRQALLAFVGISLPIEAAPDAIRVLQMRHLLAQHRRRKKLFEAANAALAAASFMMRQGTTANAVIIAASRRRQERSQRP